MNKLLEAFEPAEFVGPKRSIKLEFDDVLWAARGIYGEGGKQPEEFTMKCYLWAIMRRCLLMRNNLSYMEMWQQFSQPINPKWRRDGKFCRPGGKYYNCPECSAERLLRRDKTASMEWTDLPQSIRDTVLTFASGYLYPPTVNIQKSRLSNWASYPNVEKKFPWGIDVAGEWFFEDKNLLEGIIFIKPAPRYTPQVIS
jgi:hypothetical protein